MIFLYKLSLLNENEIRNGFEPRTVYVAASSMDKAITRYSDKSSMISACEFLYPIQVVSSEPSNYKFKYDFFYKIVYHDTDDVLRSALVCASHAEHAKERLSDYLDYSPDIESIYMIDYLVL